MAGITLGQAFNMSSEELIKASSSQEFYTDKNSVPHMVLNFSDDDIPEGIIDDMVKEFNKEH